MFNASEIIRKKLDEFPRTRFSLTPTPCHRLNALSELLGVEIYCKRDDLTGFAMGGNKSRKLEFLMEEAKNHGCDTIVACGGVQSNFCRMAAAAGSVAGMEVHLVLGGVHPERPTGNLILDGLVGANIHYVTSEDWVEWEDQANILASELEKSGGKKVFMLPVGGSVPVGVLGYVEAFVEILEDQERLGVTFDHIIHASGSGGTQAGLVVGKELTRWSGTIWGISVAMEKEKLEAHVYELAGITGSLLGGTVARQAVRVEDSFIGPGYAKASRECKEAVELLARKEGIFLDYVYTGKAMAGLLKWAEQGKLRGQKVLFIHTGGQPELFAR